jgi:hypothetical protein
MADSVRKKYPAAPYLDPINPQRAEPTPGISEQRLSALKCCRGGSLISILGKSDIHE